MRAVVFIAWAVAAAPAAAQVPPAANEASAVEAATVCAPGPGFDAVAARAAARGWRELSRREALRLQARPNKEALIRGWIFGAPEAPSYLLLETAETPRPRRLTCEVVFQEADPGRVQAAVAGGALVEQPLDPPQLEGPLPGGGRFTEWAAPEETGWRLITLAAPTPPKRGPALNRLRFSGVER